MPIWPRFAHITARSHDFIYQEQLLAENWRDVQELLFNDVVVPNLSLSGRQWLTCQDIHSERFTLLVVGLLNFNKSFLRIETGVLSKGAWNDKESFCEALDTKFGFSRNFSTLLPFHEVLVAGNLKRSTTWNSGLVLEGVLDGSETITDSILGLGNGVVVGSLDEDGAGEWVLDTLDEGILVISERLLVDNPSPTQIRLLNIIDGVELFATAGERDTLTVSALSSSDTDNTSTSKDLKRRWVDTLLVDDNEILVSAVAEALLEFDDLVDAIISELSLRFNELLSLICVRPEESRVDLSLFVLERDIKAHDVAVLEARWQVRLTTTVIENETANKSGLG